MGCGASTEEDPVNRASTEDGTVTPVSPAALAPTPAPPPPVRPVTPVDDQPAVPVSPSLVTIEAAPMEDATPTPGLTEEERSELRERLNALKTQTGSEVSVARAEIHELKQDMRESVAEIAHEMREMKATLEIFLHRQVTAQ